MAIRISLHWPNVILSIGQRWTKEVKNTDHRIQFESFIIKDLNTVYPFGMNLDF